MCSPALARNSPPRNSGSLRFLGENRSWAGVHHRARGRSVSVGRSLTCNSLLSFAPFPWYVNENNLQISHLPTCLHKSLYDVVYSAWRRSSSARLSSLRDRASQISRRRDAHTSNVAMHLCSSDSYVLHTTALKESSLSTSPHSRPALAARHVPIYLSPFL